MYCEQNKKMSLLLTRLNSTGKDNELFPILYFYCMKKNGKRDGEKDNRHVP